MITTKHAHTKWRILNLGCSTGFEVKQLLQHMPENSISTLSNASSLAKQQRGNKIKKQTITIILIILAAISIAISGDMMFARNTPRVQITPKALVTPTVPITPTPITGTPVTVAVDPASNGNVGSGFAGFSYEKDRIGAGMFDANDANLVRLFRLLGPNVLRLGGILASNGLASTLWYQSEDQYTRECGLRSAVRSTGAGE